MLSGAGSIEARGGPAASNGEAGGGGAVALEYGSTSGGVVTNTRADSAAGSGTPSRNGGAGSIWTRGGGSTYGSLTIDNKGAAGTQGTVLPSLGSGIAQAGSTGTTLVTDRAANVPAYFAGHYVEISDSSNVLKGTCQVSTAPGGIVNKTVTLTSCSLSVSPGDRWQGVYHFDTLTVPNGEAITSVDPIRLGLNGVITLAGPTAAGKYLELPYGFVGTDVTVTGNVSVPSIASTNLTVKSGAILTHPATTGATANSLTLTIANVLIVEAGASIDVSGRGYPIGVSYPGAVGPGLDSGGSHVGVGGLWVAPVGETFGSVYRPQEAGGGGNGNPAGPGGGVVRVNAGSVTVD